MISVSSEPYKQTVGPTARVPQLPVQVVTTLFLFSHSYICNPRYFLTLDVH